MGYGAMMKPSTWGARFAHYRRSLDTAQKPGGGVPAYMRWVNRRGARLVAAFGAASGWTPNLVTGISVLLSASGLVLLVALAPSPLQGVAVGVLLALGFLFDSADGQLSRVTNSSSHTGEWLDHVADAFRSPAIHYVTVIAVWLHRPESMWLALVALVYGWVQSGQFLSQILAEQFVKKAGRAQRRGGTLRSFVLLPTDPGILCWSFALWGFAVPFAVVYAGLAAIEIAHSLISLTRRYSDLRRSDEANKEARNA